MLFQLRITSIFLLICVHFFAQTSQDTINQTVNGEVWLMDNKWGYD